jgi:23S rRNA pseudouridine1911/1915/1917 synthase
MATEPLRIRVSNGDAGTRLDRLLARPVGSRAQAQRVIDAGRVRVDGTIRPKRHVVAAGEVVEVEPDDRHGDAAPGPTVPFSIAYEDQYLLVVDKPAGVVVHPARGHREGTLSQALAGLAAGGEEPERAGIVHRLDRDTSGLLVVARSDSVHRQLKSLLSSRRLRREYRALVDGHPASRSGTIDAPIGRDRRDRVAMSIDTDSPRAARTRFEVEELLPRATLLRVVLDTGRTHQIRVHLAAIGLPVSGDSQYGTAGRYGLERQFLHAARLAFEHPVTGQPIDVRSTLPDDLQAALQRARSASG